MRIPLGYFGPYTVPDLAVEKSVSFLTFLWVHPFTWLVAGLARVGVCVFVCWFVSCFVAWPVLVARFTRRNSPSNVSGPRG